MIPRQQVVAMVGIVILTMLLSFIISGQSITSGFLWGVLKSVGLATGVMMGALALFEKLAWKWNWLQGWFVQRPHLYGDWNVTIETRWVDPETGQTPPRIDATMKIVQTYSKVHVRLQTPQSSGDLLTASIERKGDGSYVLYGTYRNQPDVEFRDRSSPHNGSFELLVEGSANEPTKMSGEYWTARNSDGGTQGSITAVRPIKANPETGSG